MNFLRWRFEIIEPIPEQNIRYEGGDGGDALCEEPHLRGQQENPRDRDHDDQNDVERRQDSSDSSFVETNEREFVALDVGCDDPREQKPGDHEKYIDADEPAR